MIYRNFVFPQLLIKKKEIDKNLKVKNRVHRSLKHHNNILHCYF